MGIRRKPSVVYLILTVSLLLSFFLYSNSISSKGINEIEEQYANDNLMRAENVLKNQIRNLDRTCKDWAHWDDTYNFIQNRNQDYISSNLNLGTMKNLNLNFIILINSDGNIVHKMTFDSQNDVEMPIPPEFNDYLSKNVNELISAANEKEVMGLLFLDEKTLIISVNPILKSTSEGPSRGTLIMGQYLTEAEVSAISETLELQVYLSGLEEMPEGKSSFESEDYIVSQKVLNDINDKPAIILMVETPRDIFEAGRKQIFFFQISIILIGIFFILASFILMDRLVLSRITKLRNDVIQISSSESGGKRINALGSDEISDLADDMNNMLQNIENSGKSLLKEKEFVNTLVQASPLFYVAMDADGKVILMNDSMLKATGYSLDEVTGVDYLLTFVPEEEREMLSKTFEKIVEHHEQTINENHLLTKDGRKFLVEWHGRSILNEKGEVDFFFGVGLDITERKAAEERLKSSNKQLGDIIEFLPDATFIIDKDKKIRAWNRAIEEMTGVPKEEILGKDRSYGSVPFYGYRRPYLIDLIFESESDISSKYDFVKRKGNTLYVEVFTPTLYNNKGAYVWAIASPLLDSEGNVIGAIESIRDITEFKMAEKALRESEEKYRTLFEDSKNPIWTTSREGIILDANQATADLLGYLKDELIGLDVYSLYVDPNDRKIFQDEIEEKGFVKNFQSQWKTKDGRQLDLLFDFTLWKDNDEKIIGYRGIAEDVTLINRSQKQLGENLEYFAHLVDHIRNPLTIICGFAQVDIEDEKTKNRFLRQITRIEEIIKQLDQGWMDTEDTRRFLKRYM